MMKFAGTPLDERQLKSGKIFTTSYAPKLNYLWDTGEAMSRYLAELKQGKLIARSCFKCQRVMIPPRMFCELCFRPTDDWVYVKDTGKVNTFSLCYVSWDVRRLKQPEIPAAESQARICHTTAKSSSNQAIETSRLYCGESFMRSVNPPERAAAQHRSVEYESNLLRKEAPRKWVRINRGLRSRSGGVLCLKRVMLTCANATLA
jgi:hypothetical protein